MSKNNVYLDFLNLKAAAKKPSNTEVTIRKEIDAEISEVISSFLNENFKKNEKNSWIVRTSELDDLCIEIDNLFLESSSEEDESSSEDDELIQEVLKRRFKGESEGKVISDLQVVDSEDEDVISLSRRLRHIYTLLSKK